MAGARLVVYGGGRWRELDARALRVAGWGAVRLVRVRRGRLELLRRAQVLRALGAFVAGRASAIKEGPRLSQIRSDGRERGRRRDSSRRRSRRRSRVHTCCHHHTMQCSTDINSILRPATSTVAVQCEQTTTTLTKITLTPDAKRHRSPAPDTRYLDAIEAQVVVRNETHEPMSDDSDADFQTITKNKLTNKTNKQRRKSATKVLLRRRNQTWEAVSQGSEEDLRPRKRDKQTENIYQEVEKTVSPRKSPEKYIISESDESFIFQPRKKIKNNDGGQKTRASTVKANRTMVISSDSEFEAPKKTDKLRNKDRKRKKIKSSSRSRKQQEEEKQKVLVIPERVVMLLRDFIERDDDDALRVDLERFDADDRYKAAVFYRLNPIVCLERSVQVLVIPERVVMLLRDFIERDDDDALRVDLERFDADDRYKAAVFYRLNPIVCLERSVQVLVIPERVVMLLRDFIERDDDDALRVDLERFDADDRYKAAVFYRLNPIVCLERSVQVLVIPERVVMLLRDFIERDDDDALRVDLERFDADDRYKAAVFYRLNPIVCLERSVQVLVIPERVVMLLRDFIERDDDDALRVDLERFDADDRYKAAVFYRLNPIVCLERSVQVLVIPERVVMLLRDFIERDDDDALRVDLERFDADDRYKAAVFYRLNPIVCLERSVQVLVIPERVVMLLRDFIERDDDDALRVDLERFDADDRYKAAVFYRLNPIVCLERSVQVLVIPERVVMLLRDFIERDDDDALRVDLERFDADDRYKAAVFYRLNPIVCLERSVQVLVIPERVVMLLRDFIERDDDDALRVDLERFDADDRYKAAVFYRLNPIVCLERSVQVLVIPERVVMLLRDFIERDDDDALRVDLERFDADDRYKAAVFYRLNPIVCLERSVQVLVIPERVVMLLRDFIERDDDDALRVDLERFDADDRYKAAVFYRLNPIVCLERSVQVLVIPERVVMLLRDFIERDDDDALRVDLERFDADDRYKAAVFYRLNPIVCLERSRAVARLLRQRAGVAERLSQKEFATRLGLLSVDELSQASQPRSRAVARLLRQRAGVAERLSQKEFATRLGLLSVDELSQASQPRYRMRARDVRSPRTRSTSDNDENNSSPDSGAKNNRVGNQNNNKPQHRFNRELDKGNSSKRKREIEQKSTKSEPTASQNNRGVEKISSKRDISALVKKKKLGDQNSTKPGSEESHTLGREDDREKSSKRNGEIEKNSTKSTAGVSDRLNKAVDKENSSKRNRDVEKNSIKHNRDVENNSTKPIAGASDRLNGEVGMNNSTKHNSDVEKNNTKHNRKAEQNNTKHNREAEQINTKHNRDVEKNSTKSSARATDGLNGEVDMKNSNKHNRDVEKNSAKSSARAPERFNGEVDMKNSTKDNRKVEQNSSKSTAGASDRLNKGIDKENSSKRNRDVEKNNTKSSTRASDRLNGEDDMKKSTKHNREAEQNSTKLTTPASLNQNRAMDKENRTSDSNTERKGLKQMDPQRVLEEKASANRPVMRRRDRRGDSDATDANATDAGAGSKSKAAAEPTSGAKALYSAEEDASIVRWVSGGGRARLVNGNRLWKQLQQLHLERTGCFRSWHSLRNRYLRYLLPTLGARDLPPQEASRLRAAAAAGELKSRKQPARRNSLFHVPRVRSASGRRPAPPDTPAHPPAGAKLVDISESDAEDSPTRTLRSNAAQTRVAQPDQSASRAARNDQSASRAPQNDQSPPPVRNARRETYTPTYTEITRRFALQHRSTPNTDSGSIASASSASASASSSASTISSASSTRRPARRSTKRSRSASTSSTSTDSDRPHRKITKRDATDRSGRQNADKSGPERRLTRSLRNEVGRDSDRRSENDTDPSADVFQPSPRPHRTNHSLQRNKKGKRPRRHAGNSDQQNGANVDNNTSADRYQLRNKDDKDTDKSDRHAEKGGQVADKKDRHRDQGNQYADKKDRHRDKSGQNVEKKDRHRGKVDQDADIIDRQSTSSRRPKGERLVNGHATGDSADRQTDKTDRQKPRTRRLYNPNAI